MRVAIAAALLVACGLALSQPPAPASAPKAGHKKPAADHHAEDAAAEKRGTEQLPLVVNIAPTESNEKAAASHPQYVIQTPHEDRTVEVAAIVVSAVATVVLAIFTIALSISTCRLWREAKIASRIATRSARAAQQATKLARDEFNASHRPRFIVRRISELLVGDEVVGVKYSVYNVGDADGRMIAVSGRVWFTDPDANLPATPPYNAPEALDAKIERGTNILVEARVPEADRAALAFQYGFYEGTGGPSPFFFLGYLDYSDMHGVKRETAFLRQFDFATKRFTAINHPEYEYQD